jgi:hypothetical protein
VVHHEVSNIKSPVVCHFPILTQVAIVAVLLSYGEVFLTRSKNKFESGTPLFVRHLVPRKVSGGVIV